MVNWITQNRRIIYISALCVDRFGSLWNLLRVQCSITAHQICTDELIAAKSSTFSLLSTFSSIQKISSARFLFRFVHFPSFNWVSIDLLCFVAVFCSSVFNYFFAFILCLSLSLAPNFRYDRNYEKYKLQISEKKLTNSFRIDRIPTKDNDKREKRYRNSNNVAKIEMKRKTWMHSILIRIEWEPVHWMWAINRNSYIRSANTKKSTYWIEWAMDFSDKHKWIKVYWSVFFVSLSFYLSAHTV